MAKRIGLIIAVLAIWLCAATVNLMAINSNAGTSAYSFLKIGVGAKAVAMGNAFVGMADDETAIYYNPAGLRGLNHSALSSGYHNYLADIQSGYLSAVLPWGERRMLGVAINYLNFGSTPRTDNSGRVNGEFGGGDLALTVAYAQAVVHGLDFGLAGKFIYEKIDSFNSNGLALDLGLLYHFEDGQTSVGLCASNLGFQLSGHSQEHKDPLPVTFKVGLAHRLHGAPLNVVVDAGKPNDNGFYLGGGVEFAGIQALRLRAGYNTVGSSYKTGAGNDGLSGLSMGLGLLVGKAAFDYAFVPYADLGNSHRVYLAYRW